MSHDVQFVRKPTPFKNAVLVASLTANAFLVALAAGVITGHIQRADADPYVTAEREITSLSAPVHTAKR